MNEPVDLLLISANRRLYLEKTIDRLLKENSDFRLYCWDNASRDGSADLIAGQHDARIIKRHFSRKNLGQRTAFLWFLDNSASDLVGKVDDDIMLPDGWIDKIAPLLRREPRFGMLGCWTFQLRDWDEEIAAHKIIEVGGARIFRNAWIGGTAFLARREHLLGYITPAGSGYGLPIDQIKMTEAGFINGFPLPLLSANHMGDPRSEHYQTDFSVQTDAPLGKTAWQKEITSPARYAEWIAEDADQILREPLEAQLKRYRINSDRSLQGRFRKLRWKLVKKLRPGDGF